MTFKVTQHEYAIGGTTFDGAFVAADSAEARPVVLILHGWEGRSDAQI
jgi:dienelactone hydrolase